MKTIFECSAILFDLDGVLVDSTRSVTRQWRLWAVENGLDPDEVVHIAHGVRTIEVIRRMAPHLPLEEETRRLEKREADDIEGVAVMPGAAELLRSIPEHRWCVVTSGTRYLATSRLRFGNLPIPDVMVTADEVKQGKPHPEPYLTGARLLGFAPEQCLVIEDAPAGTHSAHAGGMKVIALPSTYSVEDLQEADAVAERLSAIRVCVSGERLQVEIS